MPDAPLPPKNEPRTSSPSRSSRTPALDAQMVQAYRADPEGFAQATTWDLMMAIILLLVTALLFGIADRLVGLASGGLALIAMGVLPLLLALAALDEVRWRRALVARHGEVPPPAMLFSRAKPSKEA